MKPEQPAARAAGCGGTAPIDAAEAESALEADQGQLIATPGGDPPGAFATFQFAICSHCCVVMPIFPAPAPVGPVSSAGRSASESTSWGRLAFRCAI